MKCTLKCVWKSMSCMYSVHACVASNDRLAGHKYFFTTLLVWKLLIRATSHSHRSITYYIILLYSNQNVKKKAVKHFCVLHLLLNSHYIGLSHIYKIQLLGWTGILKAICSLQSYSSLVMSMKAGLWYHCWYQS